MTTSSAPHSAVLRSAGAVIAAASATILLAACGGGSSKAASATTTTAKTSAATGAAAYKAYTSCLSSHGVTLPTFTGRGGPSGSGGSGSFGGGEGGFRGGFGGGGFGGPPPGAGGSTTTVPGGAGSSSTSFPRPTFTTTPQMAAAQKACASLRPKFTGAGAGAGGGGAFENSPAEQQAFTNYAACMTKNGFSMPSTYSQALQQVTAEDRQTTAYQTANTACESILQAARPFSPGSGSTTTTTAAPSGATSS